MPATRRRIAIRRLWPCLAFASACLAAFCAPVAAGDTTTGEKPPDTVWDASDQVCDSEFKAALDLIHYPPLTEAIADGDAAGVDRLLSEGADIWEDGGFGETPMRNAIELRENGILSRMLEWAKEHDRLSRDQLQDTLSDAIRSGNIEAVRLLLALGADPNARGSALTFTPIQQAASHPCAPETTNAILDMLMAAGCVPDAREQSPLARVWHISVARTLLAHGFGVDRFCFGQAPNSDITRLYLSTIEGLREGADGNLNQLLPAVPLRSGGFTPRFEAADLISSALLYWHGSTARTPLAQAAVSGDAALIRTLVDFGVDVNEIPAGDISALSYAALGGDVESIRLLLEAGAEASPAHTRWPPLWYAAALNRTEAMQALIDAGAVFDAPDDALLPELAAGGCLPAMRVLLGNNAGIDGATEWGRTALHKAVENNRRDIVEYLLANGAHIEAKDRQGFTPLGIAIAEGMPDIARLLIERDADCGEVSIQSIMRTLIRKGAASFENMELYLDNGGDLVSAPRNRSRLANLSLVQTFASRDMLDYLLRRANLAHLRDAANNTALHFAAARRHDFSPVKQLLAAGADPDARDGKGRTPVHIAALTNNPVALAILARHGADLNAVDNEGSTPLGLAEKCGRAWAAEWLRENGGK